MSIQLVPVNQWVYNLYKVEFSRTEGGPVIKIDYIASSSDNHLEADIHEMCGLIAGSYNPEPIWYSWECIEENVGHPRTTGSLYGMSLKEDGWSHGRRLAGKTN